MAQSLFWMVLSSGDGLKSVLGWGSDPGVLPWGWGSWESKIFTLTQISDILPCPRQRNKFLLVWLHLSPYFLSVSIFLLIFCQSPSFPSFSAHLHLFLHFLFVSISILIFWLSLPLSSFSVCLLIDRDWEKMRKMVTDRKQRKRQRQTENGDKDGDRQKMRIKMETDRKWGLRWRQTENEDEDGDKQKTMKKMGMDRLWG